MGSETRFLRDRVDSYQDTIDRIEPDIVMIDAAAFYASAAISLRRMADSMERVSRAANCMAWVGVGAASFVVGFFVRMVL